MPRLTQHRSTALAWTLSMPALVILLVFTYVPFFRAVSLSLHLVDPNTFRPVKFVGLEYYLRLFDPHAGALANHGAQSVGLSIEFAALVVPLGLALAVILALFAETKVRGIVFFRTVFASTMAVSLAAAGVLWSLLYSPSVKLTTAVLHALGSTSTSLLNDARTALPAVALVTIWSNLGFQFLFVFAGLQSIPREIRESALLDGALGWRGWWRITFPLLGPTLLFLAITTTISAFQAFTQFKILMNGPGPDQSTNVVVYSLFNAFWFQNNYGLASALSVVTFALILSFSVAQFRLDRRVHYS